MQLKEHVCLMARYNQAMNQAIYEAAEKLGPAQLHENRGAFFGSVFGTLNHIAVADCIWLKRLSPMFQASPAPSAVNELPYPQSLDEMLCGSLQELMVIRCTLDECLSNLAASVTETGLSQSVSYKNMKGETFTRNLFSLLMHVFNHQTHHRGQVTALLSQFGVGYGVTDLVAYIPDV